MLRLACRPVMRLRKSLPEPAISNTIKLARNASIICSVFHRLIPDALSFRLRVSRSSIGGAHRPAAIDGESPVVAETGLVNNCV